MSSDLEKLWLKEEVSFTGHPMVRAAHPTTIEVTTETHLTPRGDCIIGVGASRGVAGLSSGMKAALRSDNARVKLTIISPGGSFSFSAWGSKELPLDDPEDIVIRKSSFVCGRTLALRAESSARELPREIVRPLTLSGSAGVLRIEVET